MNTRKFSPFFYVGALLCFFLPFFAVSCQQEKLAVIPGYRLVTGFTGDQVAANPMSKPDGGGMGSAGPAESPRNSEAQSPIFLAIVDALAIMVAVGVGFTVARGNAKAAILTGGIALATHLALWIYMCNYWFAGPHQGQTADFRQ